MRRFVALALLAAACTHRANQSPPEPQQRTTVSVRNQNFSDMNVFVLGAGQRVRLGFVTGLSTQVFTLPPGQYGYRIPLGETFVLRTSN